MDKSISKNQNARSKPNERDVLAVRLVDDRSRGAQPFARALTIEVPSQYVGHPIARISPAGDVVALAPNGFRAPALLDLTTFTCTAGAGEGHRASRTIDLGIDAMAWSPDGTHVVTGQLEDHPRVWRHDGERLVFVRRIAEKSIADVVWSPDGAKLAFRSTIGDAIVVCDAQTGQLLRRYDVQLDVGRARAFPSRCLAWTRDGVLFAVGTPQIDVRGRFHGFTIRRLDVATGTTEQLLEGRDVVALACAPDGRMAMLRATGDVVFTDLDAETATITATLEEAASGFVRGSPSYGMTHWSVAWSKDGGTIAASAIGDVVVLDGEGTTVDRMTIARGAAGVGVSANGDVLVVSEYPPEGEANARVSILRR